MNKLSISGIAVATVLVAGMFAFIPQKAWAPNPVLTIIQQQVIPLLNQIKAKVDSLSLSGQQQAHLISMNTVVSPELNIAKTVHSEKQFFEVSILLPTGETRPGILEVSIVEEIFEDMQLQRIVRADTKEITCLKRVDVARLVGCVQKVPDISSAIVNGLQNCAEQFVSDPQHMNTVVHPIRPEIVKTIQAQKEVFLCTFPGGAKIVDKVVFTEIWEDLTLLPRDPVIKIEVMEFTCVKEPRETVDLATEGIPTVVEACLLSPELEP